MAKYYVRVGARILPFLADSDIVSIFLLCLKFKARDWKVRIHHNILLRNKTIYPSERLIVTMLVWSPQK